MGYVLEIVQERPLPVLDMDVLGALEGAALAVVVAVDVRPLVVEAVALAVFMPVRFSVVHR